MADIDLLSLSKRIFSAAQRLNAQVVHALVSEMGVSNEPASEAALSICTDARTQGD